MESSFSTRLLKKVLPLIKLMKNLRPSAWLLVEKYFFGYDINSNQEEDTCNQGKACHYRVLHIMEQDHENIIGKIRAGKVHELSERRMSKELT